MLIRGEAKAGLTGSTHRARPQVADFGARIVLGRCVPRVVTTLHATESPV
jgi:hypothetical protein